MLVSNRDVLLLFHSLHSIKRENAFPTIRQYKKMVLSRKKKVDCYHNPVWIFGGFLKSRDLAGISLENKFEVMWQHIVETVVDYPSERAEIS